ncbi:hypothetical protein [Actinophytocola sp. NPDC049390]|uniref:hypothetical protein n=1 Tax=Actinophytocola sp. NPDC049390 TaxID=3363894 RepID=UPI00378D3A0A
MTEEQDGPRRPPVDGPTVMGPSTGHLHGPTPQEPTLPADATAGADEEPTLPEPTPPPTFPDGPTVATSIDEATLAEPTAPATTWPYGPTMGTPVVIPAEPDEPTAAVVDESPTTTGPTVASWPLDELLPPPPTDLVWRPDTPEPPPRPHHPAYYIALGAAVVLVVALVAAAALATVVRPTRQVAGTARPAQAIPEITTPSTEPPTTTTPPPRRPDGPADHPLSTSTARMADATCALPRFDLPDEAQAAFYTAAKTCADDAWGGVLAEAGLDGRVEVVTVTDTVRTSSCGEITPESPATQCDGTVYMTPAHLRDTERNGRYPGRYFGVFLREYARALQFTTGLAETAADVDGAEERLARQATCMAGIASGAMANRGAVDANITGEIGDRLSSVDAPPDAKAWLDKGAQARTLDACNTWT